MRHALSNTPSAAPVAGPAPRRRAGMALPLAIFAIVVIGALLAGAYFASAQERKIGGNTLVEQRSFNVAEFGLNYDVSNWDISRNIEGHFPVGKTEANIHYYNENKDRADVSVTRLSETSFLVVSSGVANIPNAASQATRRTSMLVQIAYPSVTTKAAMMSGGFVDLNGSGAISGYDQDPVNMAGDCDSYAEENLAGIVVPPLKTGQKTNIAVGNGADSTTALPPTVIGSSKGIYGPATPGIAYSDASATNEATYRVYGSESWETLKKTAVCLAGSGNCPTLTTGQVGQAVSIASPGPALTADGKCDHSLVTNWGEINHVNTEAAPNPFAPCINYYPVLYAPGDLTITGGGNTGGYGQGILLVEGSLYLTGNFKFNGLIIVHNDLNKGNGTVEIHGTVMVQDYKIECNNNNQGTGNCQDGTDISGTFDLRYSRCAVQNALRGSAILVPVKQRAWAELY